ncbi:2'-5' RNA ligase family protein [Streptomyces boncukensis]|uniref:2'-5' RNA ligase family protein n=1 Tax=Streptomyces boncukensis TaxID=2711219 RepID=A0A6G4WQH6_9ACTN|nr:2'-5' RNA ligase family protein [Streptomyces boncukensis]NGO67082.1 2'-5' RNA ligase family protein [Streptomyces boncukensis]
MRAFMKPSRLWAHPSSPDTEWIRPHVLWLPQQQPDVMRYFDRLRTALHDYTDLLALIAPGDLHMTIQAIRSRTSDGKRADGEQLADAADAIRDELRGLAPIRADIGPPRLDRSAAVVDIAPADVLHELHCRVRAGTLTAGLDIPPAGDPFWPHMTIGYGLRDTDTPQLAARSDACASHISRALLPDTRVSAEISTVWLVWERQHVTPPTYTFQHLHEIPLGEANALPPSATGAEEGMPFHS